jgi:hypothetical protein
MTDWIAEAGAETGLSASEGSEERRRVLVVWGLWVSSDEVCPAGQNGGDEVWSVPNGESNYFPSRVNEFLKH